MTKAAWTLALACLICTLKLAHAYQHIGCYQDGSHRDLSLAGPGGCMTPSKCNEFCTEKKFAYFGLQSGVDCSCGNKFGMYGPKPSRDCNHDCSGDPEKKCGGHWKNSIYTTDFDMGFRYLGCYADYINGIRDLPELAEKGAMTFDKCHLLCKQKKFKYFGLQNANSCWCGNSYGKFGQRPYEECGRKCSRDAAELCGAQFRNTVYEIRQPQAQRHE